MKRWTGWTRTRWSWTGSPWLGRTPSRGRRSRIYWHSSRQNQRVEQSPVLTARNIVQKNNDKNNKKLKTISTKLKIQLIKAVTEKAFDRDFTTTILPFLFL